MKKKIILMLAAVTLLSGCGKTIPKLSNGDDAVVSFKDGSKISVNELYEEMKNDYATNVLITMIDKKLLEEKYEDKLEEAKEYAKNVVEATKKNYVDEKGNYDEKSFLNQINMYGYSDEEVFEEAFRLNYLKNLAVDDYVKSTLTDKEIEKYYKDEIVGDRDTYHIQIIPDVKTSMTDSEKKEAEEKALNDAKAIIARLKKGESFEDLAKEKSDDEATKENGGSLGFINKGYNGSEEFDKALYSLKVGEYSETPVKTTNGYEILYVKEEKEKKSLDDARSEIEKTLIDEKLEKDSTLQITAITELRKEKGLDIIDSEIERSYNRYIDNIIQSLKEQDASKDSTK